MDTTRMIDDLKAKARTATLATTSTADGGYILPHAMLTDAPELVRAIREADPTADIQFLPPQPFAFPVRFPDE